MFCTISFCPQSSKIKKENDASQNYILDFNLGKCDIINEIEGWVDEYKRN